MLVAVMALADDAWKWTDENGVVHYSDVPADGAERVDLSEYSRTTGATIARGRSASSSRRDEAEIAAPEFKYESISIAAPAAE